MNVRVIRGKAWSGQLCATIFTIPGDRVRCNHAHFTTLWAPFLILWVPIPQISMESVSPRLSQHTPTLTTSVSVLLMFLVSRTPPHIVDRFGRVIRQNACFRVWRCHLGLPKIHNYFSFHHKQSSKPQICGYFNTTPAQQASKTKKPPRQREGQNDIFF